MCSCNGEVWGATHALAWGHALGPKDGLSDLRPFIFFTVQGFEECLPHIEVRPLRNPVSMGVVAADPDMLNMVLLF